ncbi:hypothetical protein VPNG_07900 [Cytospora leucostoma]|uniref:Chromosome transmission fidelity protein 8 n=1 Tax=Cytospora leucostoma TaxID=1230097 RepID=A0A423WGW7_9PEZI|nr:hypothetical protein VPNG_07900 [Cytospora leucostoma]
MATPSTSTPVTLHPRPSTTTTTTAKITTAAAESNPLPQLLQTPSGLALLELQGTFNLPAPDGPGGDDDVRTPMGRIDFPDYRPDSITFDPAGTAWMKRVYMFVGQHQRLTGEVKKLPRALGVVRRRGEEGGAGDELEVVEIVKYKVVFSSRPEPVGTAA